MKPTANPCIGHDCYDPDMGCLIPGGDRWYACPLMPDPDPKLFAELEDTDAQEELDL